MKDRFGYDNVINIGTFGREGSKSATQTACRGLGIDVATARYLSSLIPTERGATWTLKEMFEGDKETEKKPNKEFINEVAQYEGLKETMFMFEGLVNKRSVHASGVFFFDEETKDRYVMMRSPNGQKITQFDMDVSEEVFGLVKMD